MRRTKNSWTNPREPLNPNRKTDKKLQTAQFLNEILEQNNLKPKDLCELLGVVESTIRGYKNASREIPEEKINILKRTYNHTYKSNDCEEEVFQTKYELVKFLKQFNLNENEFQCLKYYYIDYLIKKINLAIDEDLKVTILEYTDKSVMKRYITSEKLKDISYKFKSLLDKPINDSSFGLYREKIESSYTWVRNVEKAKLSRYKSFYNDLIKLDPKDVINNNNIPCYNISDIQVDNIKSTPIKMYIDIPQSLKNDSYTYFAIFINNDLKSIRYHYGDVVIIREGESFSLEEYDDELLVLRNGELTFSTFSYAYENHEPILYVMDTDDNEWYHLKSNEMYIYKVIGTVIAILPRVIQDRKEKDNGIFNRELQTLSNLQED